MRPYLSRKCLGSCLCVWDVHGNPRRHWLVSGLELANQCARMELDSLVFRAWVRVGMMSTLRGWLTGAILGFAGSIKGDMDFAFICFPNVILVNCMRLLCSHPIAWETMHCLLWQFLSWNLQGKGFQQDNVGLLSGVRPLARTTYELIWPGFLRKFYQGMEVDSTT